MNESLVFSAGVFAFAMMLIGLGLTAWEFRYGQPRREAARVRARERARPSTVHGSARAARSPGPA